MAGGAKGDFGGHPWYGIRGRRGIPWCHHGTFTARRDAAPGSGPASTAARRGPPARRRPPRRPGVGRGDARATGRHPPARPAWRSSPGYPVARRRAGPAGGARLWARGCHCRVGCGVRRRSACGCRVAGGNFDRGLFALVLRVSRWSCRNGRTGVGADREGRPYSRRGTGGHRQRHRGRARRDPPPAPLRRRAGPRAQVAGGWAGGGTSPPDRPIITGFTRTCESRGGRQRKKPTRHNGWACGGVASTSPRPAAPRSACAATARTSH